ncbi:MAG: DsrE family protein, partial [Gillisia sp.]
NKIAQKISAMDSDGIRFEICMTAAHALGVSADSILPEIMQVENGWISLIGYQQNGYSMIADF